MWCIRNSTTRNSYWSVETDQWTDYAHSTPFTEFERMYLAHLPIDGEWVRFGQ